MHGRIPTLTAIGTLLATSCADSEDESFRVTEVDLDIATGRVTLTFSEAIAEPRDVDPSDFRLSMGRSIDGGPYETTIYAGLAYEGLVGVSLGPDPTQLVIDTGGFVPFEEFCEQIDLYVASYDELAQPGTRFDMAMFVHYAAGDIPITNATGDATLADVAPAWVLSTDAYLEIERYGFVNPLRIPCP